MGAEPTTLLDWTLWNAARGFRVFPCEAMGRTPMVKKFYDRATTDESVIRQWWGARPNANPAISTDGLIVLDADVKNGKTGLETLAALKLEQTYEVDTPSGGRHAYYVGEARNSVEEIGPGLDVRGHHGYVLAAGAVTGSGRYAPRSSERKPILYAGPVRLDPGLHPAESEMPRKHLASLDTDANLARAERWLSDDAALAVEGSGGDATTFKVAATLKDFGLSEYAAWDLLSEHWNDRCSPPWTLEALEEKVKNAYLYGANPPGSQTPEADFQGIDIPPPPRTARTWSYHGDPPVLNGDWLLHETLPSVGTLLVVGPSQGGKTFLLTELARCVAGQQPFFDIVPEEKGAVLMVFAGTEGAGIENRLAALQVDRRLPIAYTDGVYLRQQAALNTFVEDLKAQSAVMKQHFGVPLRLVVLETISASGLIEKENDSDSVTGALVILGKIAKELGILFATSHHPPKDGDGPRGSGAFTAVVDSVLQVRRDGDAPVRVVELTKARNAAQRKLGSFTLIPVTLGQDKKNRPVVSMKLTMSQSVKATRKDDMRALLVEKLAQDIKKFGEPLPDGSGRLGIGIGDLRASFNEDAPISDRGNRSRAFKHALADAQEAGAVGVHEHTGKTLYFLKEITT